MDNSSNQKPKISIIIPVYKSKDYIGNCIQSLLSQQFTDWEAILIDDGSPDECGEICDNLSKKDSRFVVIHQPNQGQAAARNVGIDVSRGDYIMFLDSDDELGGGNTLILNAIRQLNQNRSIDFLQFAHTWIDLQDKETRFFNAFDYSSKQEIGQGYLENMITGVVWDKIYRKSCFDNLRFPTGQVFEDTWLILELIPRLNHIVGIDLGEYRYILRKNSTTTGDLTPSKFHDRVITSLKELELTKMYDTADISIMQINQYVYLIEFILKYKGKKGYNLNAKLIYELNKLRPSWLAIRSHAKNLHRGYLIKILFIKCLGFSYGMNLICKIAHN